MTDDTKLNTLNSAPVPPARADARARALAAARAAFEASADETNSGAAPSTVIPGLVPGTHRAAGDGVEDVAAAQQKIALPELAAAWVPGTSPGMTVEGAAKQAAQSETTQQQTLPFAPKRKAQLVRPTVDTNTPRRRFMLSRNQAIAASVATLCIAAPVALSMIGSKVEHRFSKVAANVDKGGPGPVRVPVIAVAPAPQVPEPLAMPGMVVTLPSAAKEQSRQSTTAYHEQYPKAPAAIAAPMPSEPRMAKLLERREALQTAMPHHPVVQENERAIRELQEQRNRFEALEQNPIKRVAEEPVSTFSLDVDTASYAVARRQLNGGRLPPAHSVRVEEFVNYFPYTYQRPDSAETPFAPQVTLVPSPWNVGNHLVHIGIKGYTLSDAQRPRANLVLLIDISGSMGPQDRLPLLKNAFRMLVEQLRPDDTIGIVTYASGSDIRLAPTPVENKAKILAAIDSLVAHGSTHGAQGLQDAYRLAEQHFDPKGVNRIILGTDGDWNVGITNKDELKGYIERKRQSGVFLSILGVGMGNYNDALMQTLARNGNGVAAYIDTLNEARKVLVEEASSSIFPIAKDVKVQIEFNPQTVSEYRLIGYEKRMLQREDFNNDKVDAGDIGSGHTVTAIYEVTPVNAVAASDPLRYQAAKTAAPTAPPAPAPSAPPSDSEFAFLKLRYKLPKEDTSRLMSVPVTLSQKLPSIDAAPVDVRFSIAVAAFAQLLRNSPHLKGYRYDDILSLAGSARGDDPFGYRAEFLNLVRLAKSAAP